MVTTQIAELTDLVRRVLRNPDIELDESTRFEDLAAWDSMDLISVVVEVEVRFDVLFDVEEVETLLTAGDLLRLIAGKQVLARA
jgi:acyl carrier protein